MQLLLIIQLIAVLLMSTSYSKDEVCSDDYKTENGTMIECNRTSAVQSSQWICFSELGSPWKFSSNSPGSVSVRTPPFCPTGIHVYTLTLTYHWTAESGDGEKYLSVVLETNSDAEELLVIKNGTADEDLMATLNISSPDQPFQLYFETAFPDSDVIYLENITLMYAGFPSPPPQFISGKLYGMLLAVVIVMCLLPVAVLAVFAGRWYWKKKRKPGKEEGEEQISAGSTGHLSITTIGSSTTAQQNAVEEDSTSAADKDHVIENADPTPRKPEDGGPRYSTPDSDSDDHYYKSASDGNDEASTGEYLVPISPDSGSGSGSFQAHDYYNRPHPEGGEAEGRGESGFYDEISYARAPAPPLPKRE